MHGGERLGILVGLGPGAGTIAEHESGPIGGEGDWHEVGTEPRKAQGGARAGDQRELVRVRGEGEGEGESEG